MKKFLSLTLAFAMLFAIAVPSLATDSKVKLEVLDHKEMADGSFSELTKVGDISYYIEVTNHKVISMAFYPDGSISKYVRDIDSKEADRYVSSGATSNFIMTADSNFEFVETVKFDVRPNEALNLRGDMFDEVEEELYAELRQREGTSPYYARNIAGYSNYGLTCTIYETHTQQVYDHGLSYFQEGVELASVLSGTSLTMDALLFILDIDVGIPNDIVDWTTGTLIDQLVVGTCSANAMYTQFANISGETYYSAGQTKRYFGGYFYGNATFGSTPVVTTHAHFDNLPQIAEMAFYYYMGY